MESTPRRRWFRFAYSLQTLFIVVTIFGVWLGWQLSIVRERQAVLAPLIEFVGQDCVTSFTLEQYEARKVRRFNFDYCRISLARRLLGDESYVSITVMRPLRPEWIQRIARAFPEAQLSIASVLENGNRLDEEFRDSLFKPDASRLANRGTVFKTGRIEK